MKKRIYLMLFVTLLALASCGDSNDSSEPAIDLNIPANFNVDLTSSYEMQKTTLRVDKRDGLNGSSCRCFFHAVVYTDLDNDGDVDIFMSGGDTSSDRTPVEVHINDGSGNFTLDNTIISGSEPGAVHPRKAILGDFNGDDRLDIFVVGHGFDQPPHPGEHPLLFLSTANGLVYDSSMEARSGPIFLDRARMT